MKYFNLLIIFPIYAKINRIGLKINFDQIKYNSYQSARKYQKFGKQIFPEQNGNVIYIAYESLIEILGSFTAKIPFQPFTYYKFLKSNEVCLF